MAGPQRKYSRRAALAIQTARVQQEKGETIRKERPEGIGRVEKMAFTASSGAIEKQFTVWGDRKCLLALTQAFEGLRRFQRYYELRSIQENEPRDNWEPFQEVPVENIDSIMQTDDQHFVACYMNNLYMVLVYEAMPTPWGMITWVTLRRTDRNAVDDWRDLQRLKNELFGADAEALQLFPAEDRLVDTSNQFHMFILEPGARVPFGFDNRLVADNPQIGTKQRVFRDEERPADCVDTRDQLAKYQTPQFDTITDLGEPAEGLQFGPSPEELKDGIQRPWPKRVAELDYEGEVIDHDCNPEKDLGTTK